MSTPVWSTTLGKIASIDEQVSYSKQLEANTSDSTAITYSIIAGSLPSGIELTSSGLLTGTPAEVAKRTRYTFAVRATAGAQITDRTFWIDVEGADGLEWNVIPSTMVTPILSGTNEDFWQNQQNIKISGKMKKISAKC